MRESAYAYVAETCACARRKWEETFPGDGDNARLVALIECDSKGYLIREISPPITGTGDLRMEPRSVMNHWWVLTDGDFSVEVGNPGDASFQRAARAVQYLGGSWDETAIILEWIFAPERCGYYGNIFKVVDGVLNRRHSKETMASLRPKVRAAMG